MRAPSTSVGAAPFRSSTTDRFGQRQPLRVAWVADPPAWLEAEAAATLAGAVELDALPGSADGTPAHAPDVVHVPGSALSDLKRLRRRFPDSALVLDLGGEHVRKGRLAARRAAAADLILLPSLSALREFRHRHPSLGARAAPLASPVDPKAFAPRDVLRETRDRDLRRFQRFHRLAAPVVLFVGPYTEAGGLDLALEAVYGLRERSPELRLAAVRRGALDRRYLDRCERRALGLGHHGIVEWFPGESELPLWYAFASVVCLPCRERVDPEPVLLAAAAGCPFVGSELPPVSEVVVDGQTAFLVPPGDLDTLSAALEALLGDEEEARRMGAEARRRCEREFSPASAARRLVNLWTETVDELPTRLARGNGRA